MCARVVMAYFGLQFRAAERRPPRRRSLRLLRLSTLMTAGTLGPSALYRRGRLHERSSGSPIGMTRRGSMPGLRAWRGMGEEKTSGSVRVFSPKSCVRRCTRYETLFSSAGRMEGIAVVADGLSDDGARACLLGRHARSHPAESRPMRDDSRPVPPEGR